MHIGIVGCGQLSRMMALAGIPLGFSFSFVAEAQEDTRCVRGLGDIARLRPLQPPLEIYQALGNPDVLTVEKEQLDVRLLEGLQEFCTVFPGLEAIRTCQHRLLEKKLLGRLGIACSPHTHGLSAVDSARVLSLPIVVKSCSDGYDGKNQWVLNSHEDLSSYDRDNDACEDRIMERWIPFEKEVSQVSVRSITGEIFHYPLTENQHHQGILRQSIAPATGISAGTAESARRMISDIMDALDYVGVMAMECFLVNDQLMVNELAPRVHNSGHWTQSGSATCQFENHLRAIAGLPLGGTSDQGVTGMINLIGTAKPPLELLPAKGKLHWYNKSVRPGRKLGHVNFTGSDYEAVIHQMHEYKAALAGPEEIKETSRAAEALLC